MSKKILHVMFAFVFIVGSIANMAAPGTARASAPAVDPSADLQLQAVVEVEPEVLAAIEKGSTGYLIYFGEKADLSEAQNLDWVERGRYVMETLQQTADRTQSRTRAYLDGQGVKYQSFWIDNIIAVESSDVTTLNTLTTYGEIESIKARRTMGVIEPEIVEVPQVVTAIEPNISHVNADDVWAMGYEGTGIVVANIDTGVRYTHEALVNQYRGNLGGSFNHNYSWWDPYGNYNVPTDANGHGTHTMGTTVGDDGGANQIGMAPSADWVACRGCATSSCTDAALLSCAQWVAAPWDLTGANPNPDLRPNVVNNSWGDCGQSYDNWYQGVVNGWHAAGVYPVFSNGNASNCGYSTPPGLNTVGNPARYGNVTGVGSSGQFNGLYATHSNWGPSDNPDTVNPQAPWASMKPQVVAPGVNIRSSVPSSDSAYQGGWNGTSMSAPHVTGMIALIWEAAPCLVGDYAATETLMEQTAMPIDYASGGSPAPGPGNVPNYATGWGEIDALAAVELAVTLCGPMGSLTGVVTDLDTSAPIQGATVEATSTEKTYTTLTGADGSYLFPNLPVDTYDVTVSKFGYLPTTVTGVVVEEDETTTLDVQLEMADSSVISGYVTDAETGWGLYSKITVTGAPVPPFWTDQVTGYYEITLPEGAEYTFTAAPWVAGYLPAGVTFTPVGAAVTQDIEVEVDPVACNAPGYTFEFLSFFTENFDAPVVPGLPTGWESLAISGTGVWATRTNTAHPAGQPPHSAPNLVYFNAYNVSSGGSTRLYQTTGLDLTGESGTALVLWVYHDTGYTGNADRVQVQVSLNGTDWANVGAAINRYDGSVGWKQHTVDLSAYDGEASVQLGLLGISAYGNDVHVDDLEVGSAACQAPDGGLMVGNVYDDNTSAPLLGARISNDSGEETYSAVTEDPSVDDSFYTIYSEAGNRDFSVTLAGYGLAEETLTVVAGTTMTWDFYLPAGYLDPSPTPLEGTAAMGASVTVPLTLNNDGGADLTFGIVEKDQGYMPTAGEDVLVVAYSTTDATQVEAALTANGFTFVRVTDTAFRAMTPAQLLEYTAVFYMGAAPVDSLPALTAFLDAGGQLFIADNDLGYYRGATPFYQTYLQSTYIADNGGDLLTGEGPFAGFDLNITSDPYPDSFSVGAEGTRIYSFTPTTAGGVLVERAGYTAIYVSFDFQYISTTEDKTELVGRIMDEFALDVTWLSEDPVSGTIPAFGSLDVDVTMDAAGPLLPGEYYADLKIKNNTPYGTVTVPVIFTVTPSPEYGRLEGTVGSLGYCDENPFPLEGALVEVTGTGGGDASFVTGADGSYFFWLHEDYSPYDITFTAGEHFDAEVLGVEIIGEETDVVDQELRWDKPCVLVAPDALETTLDMGQTDTQQITLSNYGAADTDFSIAEKAGEQPGIAGEPASVIAQVDRIDRSLITETGIPTGAPVLTAPAGPLPEDIGTAWETMAPLPAGRVFGTVVADEDGFVYYFGGTSDGGATTPTNTTYRYNTATNTWDTRAVMPEAVDSLDGAYIGGKIYIPSASATHVYDIAGNSWTSIAHNGGYSAREQYQALAIGSDLYVLGGIVGNTASTTEVWVLNTAAGTWSAGVPMQKSRTSFAAEAIDGQIYVAGGVVFPGFAPDMTAEKFDGTAWSYIAPVPGGGGAYTRWSYNADGLGADGLWLAAGRRDTDWNVLNHAGYYDPESDTWTTSPTIPMLSQGRVYCEGAVAADGYFYVIGGRDGAGAIAYSINERLEVGSPVSADVPWLSEDPTSGTLAADGGEAVVDVTFTANVSQPGVYTAEVLVKTTDPVNPTIRIPVTMNINMPEDFGTLAGVASSLGYCDENYALLKDVEITISWDGGEVTTFTGADGSFSYALDSAYTYDVTASLAGYGVVVMEDVIITAGETTTLDLSLPWLQPCVSAAPDSISIEVAVGDTIAKELTLSNDGHADTGFTITEKAVVGAGVVGKPVLPKGMVQKLPSAVRSIPPKPQNAALVDILLGGDFEAGSPNPYWAETSTNYGTPLCDEASCGTGGGTAGAHGGLWWAWFGGATSLEVATLDQDVIIPAGTAELSFWMWWGTVGLDTDYFQVLVDNVVVYEVTGADAASYAAYTLVTVDLSDYADGAAHNIMLKGVQNTAATTNINIDDVVLDSVEGTVGVPWLDQDPKLGTLVAGDTEKIQVTFTALPTLTVGTTYSAEITITTTDPVNPKIVVPVEMTVVERQAGVSLGADVDMEVTPGEVMHYTLWVENTGTVVDTFQVSVDNDAWDAQMDITEVGPLAPGEKAAVEFTLTGPMEMPDVMVQDYMFTATSDEDASVSDDMMMTVHYMVAGVSVGDDAEISGAAGATLTYTVVVENLGSVTDSFVITIDSDVWGAELDVTEVGPLAPGETAEVVVTVTIPADASAGDMEAFTITATSVADDTVSDDMTLTVTALGPESYTVYLPIIKRGP